MTPADPEPLVSVNILSHNRVDELRITLANVYGQDYPHIEVIVVDNASTDGSAEMVEREFPGAILIRRSANIGIAGWNDGFRAARGEFFLVLDDDCHIEGGTIRRSLEHFRREDTDILSYHVIDPGTRYSFTLYFPSGIFWLWGCAFMMRRTVLDAIGGFDENIFLYQHESEYVLRALSRGFTHRFLLTETAYHRKDPSQQLYDRQKTELEFYGRVYSYWKHLRGIHRVRMALYFSLDAVILFLRSVKKYSSFDPFPFTALARAIGRAHHARSNGSIDKSRFIIDNDVNCVNPLRRLLLRKISPGAERDFLCRYFSARSLSYPDFNEEYFLRRIPFKISEGPER